MADIAGETPPFRKYLLGDLPESEIEKLEQGFFLDVQGPGISDPPSVPSLPRLPGHTGHMDEFWAVFGEITEEYLSGELSENESRKFERRLQSAPALREMFENEKALFAYASGSVQDAPQPIPTDVSIAEPGRDSRWPFAISFNPAWLAVTAGVALILLFAWVSFRNLSETSVPSQQTKVKDQITPNSATTHTVAPQAPQASGGAKDDQLAKDESSSKETPTRGKSTSNANRGTTAPFLLLASGERAEGNVPTLAIPAQKDIVTLDLELVDDDCAVYSAELRSRSNEVLRSWGNLQARREHSIMRLVSLRFEASLLKNADYLIRLSCETNSANPVFVRDYDFKVEMKPSR